MTPLQSIAYWTGVLVLLTGIICAVGRLAVWAIERVDGWLFERRLRARAAEAEPGMYFASDRKAADWLIADSAGRPKV